MMDDLDISDRLAKFDTAIQTERRGSVGIWWFPTEFSQSRFGDRSSGSNACTLIAILVAYRCYSKKIKINCCYHESQDRVLITAFANSIMEGNEIHDDLFRKGSLTHVNMTVPEAIEAAGPKLRFITEWKSLVYLMDLGETLFEQLNESLVEWYKNPPKRCGSDLYVILIADNRSVLFIFQQDTDKVTLVDSHQHQQHGAVVAQVATTDLNMLCGWYYRLIRNCYGSRPECYELSYLYFKQYESGEMAIN